MKTRNIFILSIVFVETLFLGFTGTYELLAIDIEDMKTAVEISLREEKEIKRLEALKLECQSEEFGLFNLELRECGASDGTITITTSGSSGLSCVLIDKGPFDDVIKRQQNRFLSFSKENEITFLNKKILD